MPLIVMVAYGADRTSIVLWFVLPLVPRPYQYKDASAPYRQNLAPEKEQDRGASVGHGFTDRHRQGPAMIMT